MRTPVLVADAEIVANLLVNDPGEWKLIGTGELERFNTMNQTAYRIRHGQTRAFQRPGGRFEAKATCATNRPDPIAPVELTARWVPDASPTGAAASLH